jgi:plasmid stabilization system protein ParE
VKKFRIIIAPIVQDQIRTQVLYIARDSINSALAWESRLRSAVKNIAILPTRNPIDNAAPARIGQQIRKMVFERTYLLFYRISHEKRSIDILNFRHGTRLPHDYEP